VFWVVLNGVRSPAPRAALGGTLLALATVAVALACYQCFGDHEGIMLGRRQAPQFMGRSSGCFGIPNSLAALLVLLLPATGALAARPGVRIGSRVFFGALAAFFAFGLYLTISRGGWLALGLALAAWPLCAGRAPLTRRLGHAVVVAALGVAAVGTLYLAAPPVRARLDALVRDAGERTRPILWRGALAIFGEHPLWGGGAGSFNVLFEQHRPERYQDEPQWAHSDYLNTLADYGAVGFVLFFGACGVMIWRYGRRRAEPGRGASLLRPPPGEGRSKTAPLQNTPRAAADSAPVAAVYDRRDRPNSDMTAGIDRRYSFAASLAHPWVLQGLAIGLLAFALHLLVDFHFKLPALAMAFAVCAALLVSCRWPTARSVGSVLEANPSGSDGLPTDDRPTGASGWMRIAQGVAALGVLAAMLFFVVPHDRAEALRYGAREAIDRLARAEVPANGRSATRVRARDAFARAVALDPKNAQAWADLSYALSLWMHEEPARTAALGREAEVAARRALTLTAVLPEAWVRLGVALDMQGRWVEGGQYFARAVELAPAAVNIRYYLAYHLSLRPVTQALARAEADACLILDPSHRAAQALRQQLATSPSAR
jgi:tetratricopeptide (TPR) repeat protein